MYFSLEKEGERTPQAVALPSNSDTVQPSEAHSPAEEAKELLSLHAAMPNGLNFDLAKALALTCVDEILEHWLPDGQYRGRQYVAYNPTRNDSGMGSFTINTESGLWSDFATEDRGSDLISLVKYVGGYSTQVDAAVAILEFIAELGTGRSGTAVKHHNRLPAADKQEFNVIMPVPEDASPPAKFFGSELGTPSMSWQYKDAAGQLLFYVLRFDTSDGKTTRPYSYCVDATGHRQWRMQAPPAPRPAYGLDRLAARPNAPVLFNEGEKAADAAQDLFPDFACVTTMNGARSPDKTDFSPFKDRRVFIAPDADEAGQAYKDKLVELLTAAGATVVAVLRMSVFAKNGANQVLPEGYDLADALADGWTVERIQVLGDGIWLPLSPNLPPDRPGSPVATSDSNNSDAPRKISMPPIIKTFVEKNYPDGLRYVNGEFYAYQQGYWPRLDQQADIRRKLAEFFGANANANAIKETLTLLKDFHAFHELDIVPHRSLLCLKNGTFDTATNELRPHSPAYNLRTRLDIEWDPTAACPRWLQFMDEIFAHDSDKVEKIAFVQEFMGYCLVPDISQHIWVLMVGAGGNGKSVLLKVLSSLIGRDNISNAHIERLGDKHVRAELENKLVNISSEMSANATVSDGYLKQIVSGDEIEAERKFKDPFSFKPFVRLIASTNNMPRLLDLSDGFFRRLAILSFNRQFNEAEKDPNLEDKLLQELPGIFCWAVEGLQRLRSRERPKFNIPRSSATAVRIYREESDPVHMFADETLTKVDEKGMTPFDLYSGYKAWCRSYGFQPLNKNNFGKRLADLGYGKHRSAGKDYWQVMPVDPQAHYWSGSISSHGYLA